MNTQYKLKTLLLLLVGGPLFFLLLIEMLVSYGIGLHVTNEVFDRWLLDSAYSLAQEIRRDDDRLVFYADEAAIEVFEWDELDDVYFRVSTPDGQLLGGRPDPWVTHDITSLKQGPIFTNVQLGGEWVRTVSILANADTPENSAIVSVAETLHKRIPLARTLMVEVLFSKMALFVVALLVVSFALSRGIRPLVKLSQALASRSSRDLTPIDSPPAPQEIRSLIDNSNRLLGRLDTALSSREQFIGNIAHQLKTPLAGIKLQAQLALRDRDIDSVHQSLERICQTTDAMSHLNSQLLKLARAEAASGRGLEKAPVALEEIVQDVVASLREFAVKKDVEVRQERAGYSFEVLGESLLLRELVWNLVENAILYVPTGGRVWVNLAREDGDIVLTVKDNGKGIPREHWPQIFDRFFRPQPIGDGCGLGLAIVREIALAHRAEAELTEAPDSHGACFTVRFPAADNS